MDFCVEVGRADTVAVFVCLPASLAWAFGTYGIDRWRMRTFGKYAGST